MNATRQLKVTIQADMLAISNSANVIRNASMIGMFAGRGCKVSEQFATPAEYLAVIQTAIDELVAEGKLCIVKHPAKLTGVFYQKC